MSEIFPCGALLSHYADEMFIEVPLFSETSPALRNFWLRAWKHLCKHQLILCNIVIDYLERLTKVHKYFTSKHDVSNKRFILGCTQWSKLLPQLSTTPLNVVLIENLPYVNKSLSVYNPLKMK